MDAARADRFRPEPRVLRLPEWRAPEGEKPAVRFDDGEWRTIHPIQVAALEALRDGGGFDDALARGDPVRRELKPNHAAIILRHFFWDLAKRGHIDIPLEAAPAVFADRYRRVRELGRGNVGVVHLCIDETNGREVVVKHAWGYLTPIDDAEKGIRAEDELLRAFEHPGIPRRLGSFEHEGLVHIVREYVDGETVAQRVAREGSPGAAERARILREAIGLVAHMHARGYLFLDPTPKNFLLRVDGSVSVIDVGICKRHENGHAVEPARVGSRGYISPEAMDRGDIGVWSDVFALASFHFFLASGKAPGHRWTEAERAEHVAKLDLAEGERAMLLGAWAHDISKRCTIDQLFDGLRSAEPSA